MVNAMTASHADRAGALPSVAPIVTSAQNQAQMTVRRRGSGSYLLWFCTVERHNPAGRAETTQCARVVIASFQQPLSRRFWAGARAKPTSSAWWITLGRFPNSRIDITIVDKPALFVDNSEQLWITWWAA